MVLLTTKSTIYTKAMLHPDFIKQCLLVMVFGTGHRYKPKVVSYSVKFWKKFQLKYK